MGVGAGWAPTPTSSTDWVGLCQLGALGLTGVMG